MIPKLVAHPRRSSDAARRGAVYMNPATMEVLSILEGDPVVLAGPRQTLAVAFPDERINETSFETDSLVMSNASISSGASVEICRGPLDTISELTLELPEGTPDLDEDLVRALLVDKALTVGDKATLIPLVPDESNAEARSRIMRRLGTSYAGTVLSVRSAIPAGVVASQTMLTFTRPAGLLSSVSRLAADALSDVRAKIEARSSAAAASAPDLRSAATNLEDIRREIEATAARREARASQQVSTSTPSLRPATTSTPPSLKVEDLPTLEVQAAELEEWLDLGFNHHDVMEDLGSKPQMGMLLVGPKGSGKESLVRAVVTKMSLGITVISGSRVNAMDPAAAHKEVMQTLGSCEKVVLFTDADLVFKAPQSPLSTMLMSAFDSVLRLSSTAIIATTTKSAGLDPDFRALVGHAITIAAPARPERQRILEHLCSKMPLDGVDFELLAARTPGFVASDLRALCDAAALAAARRSRALEKASSAAELESAGRPRVLPEDFANALKSVKPSSIDGSTVEPGSVKLDDVRGVDSIKQSLVESVLWPLSHPDSFKRLGIEAPRGVLLYGPPGCGKTYLVKALAGEGRANIFAVKGAELLSKWVGESESQVRDVFRRAREASPSIIFLDEIDALAPSRGNDDNGVNDRVVASLLTELDGVEGLRNVVVIGATNRPDLVDPALLRPGRLGKMVFVPPPDAQARAEILEGAAKDVPFDSGIDWNEIAALAENFSAADCAALVQEAALTAMRENLDASTVTRAHLDRALSTVRPSLDEISVERLKAYAESR